MIATTWMWISMIVVLVGAQLNAEENSMPANSTVGPDKVGERGAVKANTIGSRNG